MNIDIINHFEKIGYKFIDLISILKTIDDCIKFMANDNDNDNDNGNDNGNHNKDDNIIYILNLELTSSEIANLFIKTFKIKYDKCTIYLNKDNWIINNNINKISIRSIQTFLEQENDILLNCNICFNDYTIIMACPQCNFQYCEECILKIRNNKRIICIVCKYTIL
jgi:hypothetical protein